MNKDGKWKWQVDVGNALEELDHGNQFVSPQTFYFDDEAELVDFLRLMVVRHKKMALVKAFKVSAESYWARMYNLERDDDG